ncbi:MAG: hypothetical protein ACK53W_06210, partial [Gemmatimonadota bacterium]
MPHHQSQSTLQRRRTTMAPAAVLDAAEEFFTRRNAVYTAFLERRGDGHAVFRGQGGEEIAVGAQVRDGATEVTGSSYMFDAQVARFLSTLPVAAAPAPPGPGGGGGAHGPPTAPPPAPPHRAP